MLFKKPNDSGFTLVELIISIAIVMVIGGSVIIMMTRGASNVQRGSYIAQASSQADWIVSTLRRDMTNSRIDCISPQTKWTGSNELVIKRSDGKTIKYMLSNNGSGHSLLRNVVGGRKQYFAKESLKQIEGTFSNGIFKLSLIVSDPEKKAKDITWSALITPPKLSKKDKYWKPLASIKK